MAEAEGFDGMPAHHDLSEDVEFLSTDALPLSPGSSEASDILTQRMQTTNFNNDDESNIQHQTGDSSLDIRPYYYLLPDDLKVNYHDGVIIYHEDDRELAVSLQQRLVSIRCGDRFPDIVLGDDTIKKTKPFFSALENLINRSTYMFILVTSTFTADDLSILIKDSCLMKIVYDTERSWSVIPVWTEREKHKRPFGLNAIKGINFHQDHQFPNIIRNLMKERGHVKLMAREEQERCQIEWINSNKKKSKLDPKCNEADEDSDESGLEYDDLEYELLDQRSGHFAANKDHFQPVWENKMITLAAVSVCYINTPGGKCGTGFRAGSKYIFTAAHVVGNLSSDIEDESTRQQYYAIFEYIREQQFNNAPKFYFRDVAYENKDLDTAVIELDEMEGYALPQSFTKFDDLGKFIKNAKDNHTDNTFFFVGHPDGLPMQHDVVDKHFPLRKHNIKRFRILNDKSIKEYKCSYDKDKQLRNLFDARRVLFNCNFRHGGSGSPGVYYGESDTPVVVTFLQQGYPWWYYRKVHAGHKWKEVDCVQQGINFDAVYKDMKEKTPELCNDIFSKSVINFEKE